MSRIKPIHAVAALVLGAGLLAAVEAGWAAKGTTSEPFDRLKKLAGSWEMNLTPEMQEHFKDMPPATLRVEYRLSGAGSALVETLFPGSPYEMITVYHMDGGDVVLTHYCAAGNQPRMKSVASDDPKTLAFRFSGGSNIDPARDMHMHEAKITFVDDNRLRSEWVTWAGGKQTEVKSFDLTRRK